MPGWIDNTGMIVGGPCPGGRRWLYFLSIPNDVLNLRVRRGRRHPVDGREMQSSGRSVPTGAGPHRWTSFPTGLCAMISG